jgi:phenylpropionate dioxygenase-like ring-hydroxylating dioxygenase large terminal subunit
LIIGEPAAAGMTTERTYLLVPPAAKKKATKKIAAGIRQFWDEVNKEDVWIVERVQQGLQAKPYPGGRMCYRFEEPVHRFQNMVIDKMLGTTRVPPGDDEADPALLAYLEPKKKKRQPRR